MNNIKNFDVAKCTSKEFAYIVDGVSFVEDMNLFVIGHLCPHNVMPLVFAKSDAFVCRIYEPPMILNSKNCCAEGIPIGQYIMRLYLPEDWSEMTFDDHGENITNTPGAFYLQERSSSPIIALLTKSAQTINATRLSNKLFIPLAARKGNIDYVVNTEEGMIMGPYDAGRTFYELPLPAIIKHHYTRGMKVSGMITLDGNEMTALSKFIASISFQIINDFRQFIKINNLIVEYPLNKDTLLFKNMTEVMAYLMQDKLKEFALNYQPQTTALVPVKVNDDKKEK